MTSRTMSRPVRWLAPLVAVGVVGAGVALPRMADATDAVDDLPPRTAAELLDAVAAAQVDGLSGTVVATSRLGLPELPPTEGGSAVSLPGLLAGSTTARVWKAGEDRFRIAVDAPFSEYDVVRSGQDVWTYDSASADVTHLRLPDGEPTAPSTEAPPLPQDAAEQLLSFVEPTTEVSVGRAAVVAGRAAYELVLDPRDPGTLVDTVRLAVDGQTSVPLRVQVFGVGQAEPAVEIGFSSVRFDVPDDSVFAFTPPPGSTVTERELPARRPDGQRLGDEHDARPAPAGGPAVLGAGWTSVVVMEDVELPESAAAFVGQLARPVEGGRVVSSALASVLLLDDGRVLIGAVPAERLVELAR